MAADLDTLQLVTVDSAVPGVDELHAIGDALSAVKGWISNRHNLVRIGWFVAGYAMIIAGLVILTKPAVDATVGAVSGTVGKAVKAVI